MILICVNPFLSHIIPTFSLAKELSNRGIEVVYLGFQETSEFVEKKGYKYISLNSCTDEVIQNSKRWHRYNVMQNLFAVIHEEIIEKIKSLSPRSVLFHISRFDIFYLPLYKMKWNLITYDTCFGSIEINASVPPSTSSYIPRFRYDLKNIYLWNKRYKRKVKDLNWNIIERLYPYNIYDEIVKKENMKRCFCIDGFYIKLPHIKFTPRELEFKMEDGIYYAGLCLEKVENREEYHRYFAEKKPLLYCSLGTMNYRYLKTDYFFKTIIEIMRRHNEWSLLITLGERNKRLEIENVPNNVIICDYVNQREVLSQADLAIIHGGAGTIKECIYHEVPMVVSPSVYDQTGNAARVYYHKLGLRNNYMRKNFVEQIFKKNLNIINLDYLEKQIVEVLNNSKYKQNVVNMKAQINRNNDFNKLVEHLCRIN